MQLHLLRKMYFYYLAETCSSLVRLYCYKINIIVLDGNFID
jgi:hypothetical protein